ncbi:unnamed protein product, partial [Polarella glacialis]
MVNRWDKYKYEHKYKYKYEYKYKNKYKYKYRAAWSIELSAEAQTEISEQAESLSRKHVEEYIKDSDIRKLGHTSSVPKEIARMSNGSFPPGQYMAQVMKLADITQPAKFQEDFEGGKWRLLLVDLVIGGEKFKAIEVESVTDLGVHLPPGTKVLLHSTKEWPLRVQNGHVLLVQDAVEVLGGWVDKLAESWKASKDVEQNRLLWRQEGIKVKPEGEGAPRWVDFDPKKARFGGNIKKEVEQ